jgi:hypothetical protein
LPLPVKRRIVYSENGVRPMKIPMKTLPQLKKYLEPQNTPEFLKPYFHLVWSSAFLTSCNVSAGEVSSRWLFHNQPFFSLLANIDPSVSESIISQRKRKQPLEQVSRCGAALRASVSLWSSLKRPETFIRFRHISVFSRQHIPSAHTISTTPHFC